MNHTSLCQSKQQLATGYIVKEQTWFLLVLLQGNSDYVKRMFVFSSRLCFIKNGSICYLVNFCLFMVLQMMVMVFLLSMFYEFKRKQHENFNVFAYYQML